MLPALVATLCAADPAAIGESFFPDDLADLEDALETVRNALHARSGTGFGAVDTTPGSQHVGMLRTWVGRPDGTILGSHGRRDRVGRPCRARAAVR